MPSIFEKQSATPPLWILKILGQNKLSVEEQKLIIRRFRRTKYIFKKIKYLENFFWLVQAIANHYSQVKSLNTKLILVGFRALEESANNYDLDKDYLFTHYASWWIYTYIRLYLKLIKNRKEDRNLS